MELNQASFLSLMLLLFSPVVALDSETHGAFSPREQERPRYTCEGMPPGLAGVHNFLPATRSPFDSSFQPEHIDVGNSTTRVHGINSLRQGDRVYFLPRVGGDAELDSTMNDVENEAKSVEHEYFEQKMSKASHQRNKKVPPPKYVLSVARNLIGRSAGKIFKRKQQSSNRNELIDHGFDDLDRIPKRKVNYPENGDKNCREAEVDRLETPLSQTVSLWKGLKESAFRSWATKIELQYVSKETAKALKTIRNIIRTFPEYGVVDLLGMYSPRDVLWSVMAFSRLQRVLESEYNYDADYSRAINQHDKKENDNDDIITDRQLLEDLAHYCSFANAAYGWMGFAFCGRLHLGGNNSVLVKRTGIDKQDIVTANWHSNANQPAYYIARDIKRKAIVLGIRGTASPGDILTDLCASAENFIVEDDPEIGNISQDKVSDLSPPLIFARAHKGMIDAAKAVARMTGKTISDELATYPDFSLVIVGHSLGGGVGAVLAAMWKRRFVDRVRSIGYGNPCVFPLNSTRAFESVCTSVMGEGDPFATISLGHLADVTKALSILCQDRGLRDSILKRSGASSLVHPKDMARENYEWCSNAMATLRKQMNSEKLLPPGSIYHMSGSLIRFRREGNNNRRNGRDATLLKSVDASIFNELKLHTRMFDVSRHIPVRYEKILARIATTTIALN